MNQQEYELLGNAIWRTRTAMSVRNNNAVKQEAYRYALALLVTDLTATLENKYPKTFDKDKFMKACGL